MAFNKSLPLPPCQSCTRSKMTFKPTVINFGRGRGEGSVAHCIYLICVTPPLLSGRSICFESVSTFLQLLAAVNPLTAPKRCTFIKNNTTYNFLNVPFYFVMFNTLLNGLGKLTLFHNMLLLLDNFDAELFQVS